MSEQEINRELAKRVRMVREWRQMTQTAMARQIKMARNTVTNMEAARKSIMLWTLIKMAAVLRVPVHVFLYPPKKWQEWCVEEGVL